MAPASEPVSGELAAMLSACTVCRSWAEDASDEIFPTGGAPALLDVVPVGAGLRAAICLELPEP